MGRSSSSMMPGRPTDCTNNSSEAGLARVRPSEEERGRPLTQTPSFLPASGSGSNSFPAPPLRRLPLPPALLSPHRSRCCSPLPLLLALSFWPLFLHLRPERLPLPPRYIPAEYISEIVHLVTLCPLVANSQRLGPCEQFTNRSRSSRNQASLHARGLLFHCPIKSSGQIRRICVNKL